ncbi:MAG: hypothetical protein ACLPV8_25450 [Steroidobacteraceae bacterium]
MNDFDPRLEHMVTQIAETRLAVIELATAYGELVAEKRTLARAIRELVDMRLLNPTLLHATDGEPHVP